MSADFPRLQPEPGCCTDAQWRLELPGNRSLRPTLLPVWHPLPHPLEPNLCVWRHRDGHRLLRVTATDRWQLRLDRRVPPQARAALAARLVAELSAATVPGSAG